MRGVARSRIEENLKSHGWGNLSAGKSTQEHLGEGIINFLSHNALQNFPLKNNVRDLEIICG